MLAPGKRLAHYEVLGTLGKGGMGEVYLANDTKLDRKVALKVLPAEMATDPERLSRFQREAKAVAALNHPNIVTIHSVEQADDVHFLTMELVEGKTLDARIPDGGMELYDFLEVAVPLAEGLGAAHDKGIAHRDLKPGNVMAGDDGRVKILDFGLAKHLRAAPSVSSELETTPQTRKGTILGTAPYMSPEQVEGKDVDVRSDVFSLGIILYEMASGDRPFQGDSAMRLFSAILKDAPEPIDHVPEAVARIIERCLEKDPSDRFESAREVHATLAQLKQGTREAIASSEKEIPWIAVLPFRNRSSDPELESFGDVLAEDIITGLSRFPYYFIVAASSTFWFKGSEQDVRAVARELGARYVLEGSVRTANQSIRVNAQLSDAVTGTGLWAETFDRDSSSQDVFALQDELTDRIVATIADTHGVIARSMGALVRSKPAEQLSAYESILQYFAFLEGATLNEYVKARTALERAVEKEPRYSSAWACLAAVYVDDFRFFEQMEDPLGRALRAARKAVELDPTNSVAHLVLALASFFRRDFGVFHSAAERAIALNPRDAGAIGQLGILISYTGDWDGGLRITRKAMKLNPHHPGWFYFSEFYDHYRKQEFEPALVSAQKINMPGHALFHAAVAAAAGQLGLSQEAKVAAGELLEVFPDIGEKARSMYAVWNFSEELIDELIDGLEKAGIEGLD